MTDFISIIFFLLNLLYLKKVMPRSNQNFQMESPIFYIGNRKYFISEMTKKLCLNLKWSSRRIWPWSEVKYFTSYGNICRVTSRSSVKGRLWYRLEVDKGSSRRTPIKSFLSPPLPASRFGITCKLYIFFLLPPKLQECMWCCSQKGVIFLRKTHQVWLWECLVEVRGWWRWWWCVKELFCNMRLAEGMAYRDRWSNWNKNNT